MTKSLALLCFAVFGAHGCTAFSTVRSAQVHPGSSVTVQASVASRPGDDAAWFWSWDCAESCDHRIPSADIVYAYGRVSHVVRPYTIGGGINGTSPYVEGYAQLTDSTRLPFGVGGRLGIPLGVVREHQVYARADFRVGEHARLLWNPGVFYHSNKPSNGNSVGSFLGLVQGFGLELGSVTPSIAIVWGKAERRTGGISRGPTQKVFVTAALSATLR
jgi:hypothetical protein